MTKPRSPLFVITDGGRARLVERVQETGAFRTIAEYHGLEQLADIRAAQRSAPAPRSVQSAGRGGHSIGADDPYRQAKRLFANAVFSSAVSMAKGRSDPGIVLIAPSRVLADLKPRDAAGAAVRGSLAKDLTKVPDHELGRWLTDVRW